MKVKIKGLVFVGFAAAVFAQSAMADANDAKTVTSKLYVDSTFQTLDNIVTTTDAEANGFDWTSETTYPSIALLNEVKSQVSGIDVVSGNKTYVSVTEGTGDNVGTFTVNTAQVPATANSGITGTLTQTTTTGGVTTPGTEDALVTAKAVKSLIDTGLSDASGAENDTTMPTSLAVVSYAEKKANKAEAIIPTGETGANVAVADGGNDKYPTTKAVYDFVTTQGGNFQPKVTDTGDNLKVGYLGSGTGATPTWKTIKGASTGTGAATDYVTINQDGTSGVYEVNLDGAQLAAAATGLLNADSTTGAVTALTSTEQVKLVEAGAVEGLIAYESSVGTTTISGAVSGNGKVPTVKNVYDFVNTNYQPKTTGTDVMVGYNGTWRSLSGDSYITVGADTNGSSVTLTNLTSGTTEFVASNGSNDATRAKLAKSGDVYDFVTGLTGGLTIPSMPSDCTTAAQRGGYCALVYGVSSGTAGQEGATYALQWTVMAPAPSNQ